jgi:hypothetical protein
MEHQFKAMVLAALFISPLVSAAPTIVAGSQGTTSRDSAIYEFSSSADIRVLVEEINQPQRMAVAPDGDIFIADVGGNDDFIWRLTPDGQLTPYYTFFDAMANPYPVVYGSDGTIYTTVNVDITVPTQALIAISPSLERRTIATFVGNTYGMAMDRRGDFFVGVRHLGSSQLLKITPAGTVTTAIASLPGPISDVSLGPDPTASDTLFLAVQPNRIYIWYPGYPWAPYLFANVDQPLSLAFDAPGYLYVGQSDGRVTRVDPDGNPTLMAEGFRGDPITGIAVRTPEALAGKTWLSINDTRNVPMEEMLAACDRVTGKCTGSVTVQGSRLDLSGYVWATRMEAIDYLVAKTAIPVDLTGTVYRDRELWLEECWNERGECSPEYGFWFNFIDQNETRRGCCSFSFEGVYRDYSYYPSPGESYVSSLFGYSTENSANLQDSSVWIERAQDCGDDDDCWDAYGYFLYKSTLAPGRLASISLSKTTVAGCQSVTGTVTLTAPAPAGGLKVALSDTLWAATVPASVTVPEGATKRKFTVKTIGVRVSINGAVSATLDGWTLSQGLTIRPMGVSSVSLYPTKVVGGSKVAGTVKLECNAPAPAGIMVDLASNFAAVANPVAASITVPAGYKSWLFDVATYPVLSTISAKISGTANGITKSGSLTVTPAASTSTTKLAFGNQVVGTTSGPRFVTLSNKGTLAFSVDSIVITGTYTSWFAFTHDCPGSLPAGAYCTIGVTFTPKAAASKSATLRIATSATSSRLTVTLTGTGVSPP